MNLDEKLLEIITKPGQALNGWEEHTIAQIKQAFAEAGYIQAHSLPKGIYNATGHSLNQIAAEDTMTGAEWFNRFQTELPQGLSKYVDIDRAARRASGLPEGIK